MGTGMMPGNCSGRMTIPVRCAACSRSPDRQARRDRHGDQHAGGGGAHEAVAGAGGAQVELQLITGRTPGRGRRRAARVIVVVASTAW